MYMKDRILTGVARLKVMLNHERLHNGLTGWHCEIMPGNEGVSMDDIADDAANMLQSYLDGKGEDITDRTL